MEIKKIVFLFLLFLNLLPGIRNGGLTIESGFTAKAQSYDNELPDVTVCGSSEELNVVLDNSTCNETYFKCYSTVDCVTQAVISDQGCQSFTRLNQQCAMGINAVDCTGVRGGSAYTDGCQQCVGGTTGRTSVCTKTTPQPGTGGGSGEPTTPITPNKSLCGDFNDIIDKVCNTEGGYVNDPNDSGGPTNHGIAWATWLDNAEKYVNESPTLENLQNLTSTEAKEIYKGEYWDAVDADEIQDGDIRYALVDFFINSKRSAVKVMQRTLNQLGANVTVDGAMGSQTVNAINQADPVKLYNTFNDNRQAFYNMLCTSLTITSKRRIKNSTFKNGWRIRVNSFKVKTDSNMYNVNCN